MIPLQANKKAARIGGLFPFMCWAHSEQKPGASVSDVLYDFPGLEAFGADLHGLHGAVHLGLDSNEVGQPGAPGAILRVGDVVAEHSAFSADFTYSRHDWTPNEMVCEL